MVSHARWPAGQYVAFRRPWPGIVDHQRDSIEAAPVGDYSYMRHGSGEDHYVARLPIDKALGITGYSRCCQRLRVPSEEHDQIGHSPKVDIRIGAVAHTWI